MRFEDVYLTAVAHHLPPPLLIETAIAEGRCAASVRAGTRMESVVVSDGPSAPEMAAAAARTALARAGQEPAELDLMLHATAYYQGVDTWPAPSYVQREAAGDSTCPAVEVRQMSNGGMAALELAARALTGKAAGAALITAGDRFCPPGFDRWGTDPGTLYGDGASAAVLTCEQPGFARLDSIVSHAEPALEGMHRGDDTFAEAPFTHRQPMNMDATKKAYLNRHGMPFALQLISRGTRAALDKALAQAEVELAEVDLFVLPHLGWRRLDAGYFRPFQIDPDRTTWSWGRTIGHLGAADQFAGLAHLAESGRLSAGQRVVVFGVGAGFTWSTAVLTITDVPAPGSPRR
jgi:3-oxoacyl-[acyl-carrier-protein] synthase-3